MHLTNRFFIVGCQRTGTTLLRLVLECHPQVTCCDETCSYAALAAGDNSAPSDRRWLGFKIPRWTEQLAEPILEDEGLLESAPRFYCEEPILFMMRDVRDTVASMLRLSAGPCSWLELYGKKILQSKIGQTAFAERYASELQLLREADDSLAATGALYWKYKTQPYFDYLERGWPVLGIPYEALVFKPEAQLRLVTRFLGVGWNRALLSHPAFPHAEVAPCGHTVGHTDTRRPIDGDSVGQWRTMFSARQVNDIMTIAGDVMERLASINISFRQPVGA
jgi:hypothetical protein